MTRRVVTITAVFQSDASDEEIDDAVVAAATQFDGLRVRVLVDGEPTAPDIVRVRLTDGPDAGATGTVIGDLDFGSTRVVWDDDSVSYRPLSSLAII